MEEDKGIGKEIGLVNAVAFDPKSSRMVIGGKNGKLSVYSLDDGKLLSEGNSTNLSPVTALAFSGGEIPIWPWPGKAR